jgi:hypothetical protein
MNNGENAASINAKLLPLKTDHCLLRIQHVDSFLNKESLASLNLSLSPVTMLTSQSNILDEN